MGLQTRKQGQGCLRDGEWSMTFSPQLLCPKRWLHATLIFGAKAALLSHCNTLHTCTVWALNTDCCCCILLGHVQALGKINSHDEVGVSSHPYIPKLKLQSSIGPASPTPVACHPVHWPIPMPPSADAAFSTSQSFTQPGT